ncbi:hypothetical protein MPTK1_4g22470 [Marchantia polymorpha subsp. ruderalis]|uniref:TLC domain-containing protein n=2 Tax=Marchantia polymorpha TaxID=3197 RepID=A0AAF6BCM9_MARPO|nr:hypothetical protein MARPO_0020s0017 [Marchantia polymorpha]BBN09763.1 hypothetical protein Mp_4g22470 [Marchantia polymorpha subsp. ruderalis]|eukprot:PTQ44345.1 hypothetical protein MARPO_0020s0017 [Marchantia polymorpha]
MADWQGLAVGTVAWGAGFGIVTALLGKKKSGEFCNRCVSMVHVFVAAYLCMASVSDWSRPLDGIGGPSSALQMRAIKTSLAYFVYDFFCCLVVFPRDIGNAVHHIITIMGLGYGFMTQTCGTELVACLWLMELSNPFMHARELFKEFGIKDTPLNMANDLSFVVIFTLARMGVGPYVVYHTLNSQSTPVVKFGAVGIQVVSVFWFYKIARMVMYKLTKKKKKAV